MKKIGLMDVKKALKDGRFRKSLPMGLSEEIAKFLQDPGCACNVPLYRKLIKECSKQLREYYPGQDIIKEEEEISQLSQNYWSVISCHVDELESKLKKLPPGRKQLAVARYENQVTIIVNELDFLH